MSRKKLDLLFSLGIVLVVVVALVESRDWPVRSRVFPLTIGLCLWMLPRVKGALVGLQWALRMHGFSGPDSLDPALPEPDPAVEVERRARAS